MVFSLLVGGAPSLAQPFVYVNNYEDGTVSVIDVATNQVESTISGVGTTSFGIVTSDDGERVYLVTRAAASLTTIDAASGEVQPAPFGLGIAAIGIARLPFPSGDRLYIIGEETSTLVRVDVESREFSTGMTPASFEIAGMENAGEVIGSPSGDRLYIADAGADSLLILDSADASVLASVPTGASPNSVAVHPDGERLYTTNLGAGTVTVIDAQSASVVETLTLGGNPSRIAVTPDGQRLVVLIAGDDQQVVILDVQSLDEIARVPLAGGISDLAITPDGSRAYITQGSLDQVAVLDLDSLQVTSTLAVGDGPFGISNIPDVGTCFPGPTAVCVQDGRFRIEAFFETDTQERTKAQGRPATGEAGFFTFFALDNIELTIKILDACGDPFERFWVFVAAMTNVGVEIVVTDTWSETEKRYFNAFGNPFEAIQDTDAFATCQQVEPLRTDGAFRSARPFGWPPEP